MVRLSSILSGCAKFLGDLGRDTAGNALMIIAASLLPLLAMVGGGLDIGRGYLVQSRLQQACDAGVLAARKRLGTEAAVTGEMPASTAEVGDRFFKTNFRDASYGTSERDFTMTLESDYSISGVASAKLPTTIMGVFGQESLEVSTNCSAQLNYSNTDVMMVLDTTGSMAITNPGDSASRMSVLREVIKKFHTQLEATSLAGSRIRYGFVPYSTNVNVGGLLKDEWVVDAWGYQSRELKLKSGITTAGNYTASSPVSGTMYDAVDSTYPASTDFRGRLNCGGPPRANVTESTVMVNETNELILGPPPGNRNTKTYNRTRNGTEYKVTLDGNTCTVVKTTYTNYVDTYAYITEPAYDNKGKWLYDRIYYDVSDWRSETNGCIEERQTYEITDYDNVDLNKALDLNLDLVPGSDASALGLTIVEDLELKNPKDYSIVDDLTKMILPSGSITQWRPMYPDWIYGREMEWNGAGAFKTGKKQSEKDFIAPSLLYTASCPSPAHNLSTMTADQLNTYLNTLVPAGSTYHDIGMIWGGRLISPTGLFAAENANISNSNPTNRNLIFLTDGQTAPLDLSYSSYGFEPIDQRRWNPKSKFTLAETVEKRFAFACNEVRKRGVTVWVIGFGTELSDVLKDCAGEGRYFEAADAAELNTSFGTIAEKVSELRIVD